MSHITYYDISSYQAGMSINGLVVCIKATEGTNYTNPYYSGWMKNGGASFAWAYHFLHAGNATAQAAHCYAVVGKTPVMIDCESEGSSRPNVSDCVEFATALRKLGGVCTLVYYPKWYANGASLTALKAAGLGLVSSDYTTYSDSGPGWAAYGGMTPVVWQYADNARVNGFSIDANAYRGTLDELKALVTGLPVATTPAAPTTTTTTTTQDDEDMTPAQAEQLSAIEAAVTGHGLSSWGYRLLDAKGNSTEADGATDMHQLVNNIASKVDAIESRVNALGTPTVDVNAVASAIAGDSAFASAVAQAVVKTLAAELSK